MQPQKTLFHLCSFQHILNEVIDNPNVHWLEPVGLFNFENSPDSQLDLPITPKAFQFRCFDKIVNVPLSDNGADQMLFSFYQKNMKPQYKTWSSKKITVVKVIRPIETDSFINARFKVGRGAASSVFEFTLVDLPRLNSFDWISILLLLLKDEQKFEPIVEHIKGCWSRTPKKLAIWM